MRTWSCFPVLVALLICSREAGAVGVDDECDGPMRLVAFDAGAEIAVYGQVSGGAAQPWRYLVYSMATPQEPRLLQELECPRTVDSCSWTSLVGSTRWKRLRWNPGEELPGDGLRWLRDDEDGAWSLEARTATGWERVLRSREPEHILSVFRSPRATYVVLGRDDHECRSESQRMLRLQLPAV